ncbi:2'-5' RNA ligase family protein [Arthrobacter sp. I2-34]|uniref:2'-5' RNA ligase family protein n=2 Tax=Arthrobacter hankyongi TaxID=2904801 RepID=A0ABS9L1X9_9MICC|nr:2'-5' RNA ligase family protein [Arthrobacter hankyongi]MCG2620656.1 2'-5' RNA ligase family protein [Arthrobacter hankyongi]
MGQVGVVIGVPEPMASELEQWRASFGDPLAAVIPPHITLVTTTPVTDWAAATEHVRAVARGQEPFTVTIRGTGTFRPVSPVVYVNVSEGFASCVQLHRKLQSGPLARELEFDFHPHVTVAHGVSLASMDAAEAKLADYAATFTVSSMGLYEHDQSGVWILREELSFDAEPDHGDRAGGGRD